MFFSNETRVSDTSSPTSFVVSVQEPNVTQYGWTKSDANAYNQLIQYVNEVKETASHINEVYKYVIDVRRYVEDSMTRLDQFNLTYDQFKIEYQDFLTKWADAVELISYVGLAYSDILAKFGEIVNMYDHVLMSVIHIDERSTFVDQRAIDADNSATDANESYIKCLDLYTDLKEGQVYRGIWNPNDGAYPDFGGTNSVWDVVLNDGQHEVVFDGKTFRSGDRLLYVKDSSEYQLLATGSGVTSVNGMNGAITITPATINAVSRAGDMMTGGLTAPTLNATGVASAQGLTFNGKTAIGGTNDTWLRLNPHSQFTSGVYVNGFARISNGVEVGTIGSTAAHTLKADGTWSHSGSGSIGGDITSNLNVLGNITEKGARVFSDNYVQPEIPFPDVWIPFNDGLQMLAGYGDEVKVDNWVVAKMASFSRASGGTYIDKSGTPRTAAVNEPRFEKEGLLIEGASTNQLISSQITTTNRVGWTLGQAATWTDDIGPDGNPCLRAEGLAGSTQSYTSSSMYCAYGNINTLDSVTYTISCWVFVESVTSGTANMQLRLSGTNNWTKNIDVPIGVWTRIQASGLGSNNSSLLIGTSTLTNVVTAKIACIQIEPLPFATSYIPTSGAAATRAADVCEVPNKGNTIEEGSNITFSMEFDTNKAYYNDGVQINSNWRQCLFWGKGNSLRNQLSIMPESSNDKGFGGFISRWGSDGYCLHGVAYHVALNSKYLSGSVSMRKTAGVRNDISFNINGTQYMAGATHSAEVDTIGSELRIGNGANTTRQCIWGHIRNFRIWHKALSDTQLKAITS